MPRDPNTLSNYEAWKVGHTDADLTINFSTQKLHGSISLTANRIHNFAQEIILDTSFLDIESVYINDTETNNWEVQSRIEPYGSPLLIKLFNYNDRIQKNQYIIKIYFSTTDKCTALQWLSPTQMTNKKHPYVFSQCEAIHCRSLFPCQDTPDSKSTYEFIIKSPLPVIVSGIPTENTDTLASEDSGSQKDSVFRFTQRIPIPSYLFAIASGDIVSARIGPRSLVATGPEDLDGARWELERDIEGFIQVAEKLVFPYSWTSFNILILPPSFPYGGMENPNFTFATPTTISGDRSNLRLFAHELAHSWSGNLVTNASWEHFWLNEGWTKYLERRIVAALYGESYAELSAVIGWNNLEDAVALFGDKHEFTKLVINLERKDPDDAFSTIPYEKGYCFLRYLENLVGRLEFDKFIKYYFTKWQSKSLDSYEFRATVEEFFGLGGPSNSGKALTNVDWETWLHSPGLPPKPDFDRSQVNQCSALAEKWISAKDFTPNSTDIQDWSVQQLIIFLERIQASPTPLSPATFQLLGLLYSLSPTTTKNAELLFCYLMIGLKAKDPDIVQPITAFLGTVGRMKFVRPLYRELAKMERETAVETFELNREFYHSICRSMVEKDLGLLKIEK